MKKLATMLKIALVMAAALLLGGGCDDGIDWLGRSRVNFKVDNEVLICYNLTNEFRTSGKADYKTEDGGTKRVGKLTPLTLDKALCNAAAIRAEEIVENFDHERPDGRGCFTVLDDLGIKAGGKGENIAMGNTSGEKTFLQWKEDNEDYDGQGHRRNMLGNYTKIGIAHDSSSGGKHWVMILTN